MDWMPASTADRYGPYRKIYRTLCLILSDRLGEVDWQGLTSTEWQLFPGVAQAEGVAPLMFWKLRGSPVESAIPPAVLDELARAYYQSAAHNSLLEQALDRVLEVLGEAGIPVVLLKGAALAKLLYPQVALRPMTDVDLLVCEQDIEKSLQGLQSLGYVETPVGLIPGFEREFGYHLHLQSDQAVPTVVELHWTLIGGVNDRRSPAITWFWSQTQPFRERRPADSSHTNGAERSRNELVLTLNPKAHLLYLSAHLVLQHAGYRGRLLWHYDLHRLICQQEERLGWAELRASVEQLHWAPVLLEALRGARERFDTPIPAGYLASLSQNADLWMTRYLRLKADDRATRMQNALGRLASLRDWRSRWRLGWAYIFPSLVFLRKKYYLRSSWLWPLYYLYRWLDILWDVLITLYRLSRKVWDHIQKLIHSSLKPRKIV